MAVDQDKIREKIDELNSLEGISGYVEKNFGNRYFSIENAKKLMQYVKKLKHIMT